MDRAITEARWQRPLSGDEKPTIIVVVMEGVERLVPDDPLNADRQAIQRWQDEGNAIADPPPAPAVVPEQISDVQFFQQLAIQGDITHDEAEAAVSTGAIPQRLVAAIAQLPSEQQFGARMKLKGAVTFNRHSPLTELLAQLLDKSAADVDAIWQAASAL